MRRFGYFIMILFLFLSSTSAQQIMYSNLQGLMEERGDTVTTLQVQRRTKNQIYT